MRPIIPTLAIAGMVALSLVACSAPAAADCTATPAGQHSASIKVSGKVGKAPKVVMPPAFDANTTERTVANDASGKAAREGDVVTANFVVYNASTGAEVQSSYDSGKPISVPLDKAKSFPGMYKALHCSVKGQRIVAAVPPADLFGSDGLPNGSGGYVVGPTDTVVFVFDITKVGAAPAGEPSDSPSATPQALPTPEAWTGDVPKVDLSGATPVVTLPSSGAPADLVVKVLQEGTGETVTESSTVTLDYQLMLWSTGEVKEQSFGTGQPLTLGATGFVPGFSAAIVGQKVGSTILVSIPPQFGYGLDPNAHPLGGQTLLFVVHIVSIG